MAEPKNNIIRDGAVIILSVILAVILAKSGILSEILGKTQEWHFIGSILAGVFFVSLFTVTPAAVVLIGLAQSGAIWEVAFCGAVGALIGDLLIFRFVKDSLADDVQWLLSRTERLDRLVHIFKTKTFHWLLPFLGALIVASPLPDEIGLAMMGLSKMKTIVFIPLSFLLNFLGILIIILVVRGIS